MTEKGAEEQVLAMERLLLEYYAVFSLPGKLHYQLVIP